LKRIGSLTIAQLEEYEALRPDLALIGKRLMVTSYERFVEVLYEDLDECIRYIEEDPKIRRTDSEDRLTSELIGMLRSRGYDASHDETIGGHSDIVVRHHAQYLWVGEAKIHSSYPYLTDGFNQLTTRYLRGTPNADQGALIIYIRNADVASVVAKWNATVQAFGLAAFAQEACPVRKELGFYHTQTHTGSGRPVRVRHIGINQHWNPAE